jgi:hypothetical protein
MVRPYKPNAIWTRRYGLQNAAKSRYNYTTPRSLHVTQRSSTDFRMCFVNSQPKNEPKQKLQYPMCVCHSGHMAIMVAFSCFHCDSFVVHVGSGCCSAWWPRTASSVWLVGGMQYWSIESMQSVQQVFPSWTHGFIVLELHSGCSSRLAVHQHWRCCSERHVAYAWWHMADRQTNGAALWSSVTFSHSYINIPLEKSSLNGWVTQLLRYRWFYKQSLRNVQLAV